MDVIDYVNLFDTVGYCSIVQGCDVNLQAI